MVSLRGNFKAQLNGMKLFSQGAYKNICYIFQWLCILVNQTLKFNFLYIAIVYLGSKHHFIDKLIQEILEYTREWQKLLGQLPVFCVQLNRAASVWIPRASEMQEGSCSCKGHISATLVGLRTECQGITLQNYTAI